MPIYGFLVYSMGSCSPPPSPYALASQGRRLDIVARILLAAFNKWPARPRILAIYLDNNGRKCLVLFDKRCGSWVFEKEAATFLIRVLRSTSPPCRVVEGLEWREAVEEAIAVIGAEKVVVLSEKGDPLRPSANDRVLYVLGSDVDPPPVKRAWEASIGPYSYLASHVVAYINYAYSRLAGYRKEQ